MGELKNTLALAFGNHKCLDTLYSDMNMNLFTKEHLKQMQKANPTMLIMSHATKTQEQVSLSNDFSHSRTVKRHNDLNSMLQPHTDK